MNNSIFNQQILKVKNKLSAEQVMMVDSYVKSNGSNPVSAWLIWFFLGWCGGHRFYLKKRYAFIFILLIVIVIICFGTSYTYIDEQRALSTYVDVDYSSQYEGAAYFGILIWYLDLLLAFIDAFFIPKTIRENNNKATYEAISLVTGKSVAEWLREDTNNQQQNFKFDSNTGEPINNEPKKNNFKFDPNTGEPINNQQEQKPEYNFDPNTGQPINNQQEQKPNYNFDPNTGQPINNQQEQKPNYNFDPNTGQPINNQQEQKPNYNFDPNTGQPINNDQNNTTDGDYTNFSGPKE